MTHFAASMDLTQHLRHLQHLLTYRTLFFPIMIFFYLIQAACRWILQPLRLSMCSEVVVMVEAEAIAPASLDARAKMLPDPIPTFFFALRQCTALIDGLPFCLRAQPITHSQAPGLKAPMQRASSLSLSRLALAQLSSSRYENLRTLPRMHSSGANTYVTKRKGRGHKRTQGTPVSNL
ncbi:uncharacterized protein CLUP02_08651 [Colletotrichum lupini]|uniref:Uncharacterized protein n=1 Tax=Colletotrichum lupini TaxID=145971 RepID=A0A9Q8ST87_9PEZI|nr:uncharacterized protein CLUP02_08651 [Colletotrichum lupini]UQC83157.1 hypothetical protein CLUP02_08651 [Colletotrichum lupini]